MNAPLDNAALDAKVLELDARNAPGLVVRRASSIEPENIEFLWPGRLARGKHTAIAGDPGDGKSQISIYIAGTITTGGEWPCGEGRAPVGNVVILSAEDGAADTIIPRLIVAGADRERVYIVNSVRWDDGGRRAFNLQADLKLLELKCAEIGDVALIIIDPISSYMGKTDSHKNSEVRSVLEPASEMAERLRVAILSITHFSKAGAGNNTKALHRFIGSIAFTGAPRAAFAVVPDPDNEGRMLFLHGKNNMAPKPQGLAYRLNQRLLPEHDIVASFVNWDDTPVSISANEAMAAEANGSNRSARDEAEEFLKTLLSDGPVPAKQVKAEAAEACVSWATVRRAKDRLGVTVKRDGFGPGSTISWGLPDHRCSNNPIGAQHRDVSTYGKNEHLWSDDAFEERAAILQFEAGLSPEEAEAKAAEEIGQ